MTTSKQHDFSAVERPIRAAVERRDPPGAVLAVLRRGETLYHEAFGLASLQPEPRKMLAGTIFDVASLTKPVATATALMLLASRGAVTLDRPVAEILPGYTGGGREAITLRHLLANSSGLPAWKPFFLDIFAESDTLPGAFSPTPAWRSRVAALARGERPEHDPGTAETYSDIGYILLGECVEQVAGERLDRFCRREIFVPLCMESTFFVDLTRADLPAAGRELRRFAATEVCPRRHRLLVGEVHDDNAFVMAGVAGHAGLFSTARDLVTFAATLLRCRRDEDPFLPGPVVREFWTRQSIVPGGTWALGWDTPTPGRSSSGRTFSPGAVGHTGFTGTSLWIEPEADLAVVLLTNRVHPSRDRVEGIRTLRPEVHDRVAEALGLA